MAPAKISGSCLCKQVQYTITGEEVLAVVCHCKNCQQISGSAFGANVIYPKSSFTIDKGENAIKQYADSNNASGGTILRYFCSNCGCPLFLFSPETADKVAVTTGSMEHNDHLKPKMEFYFSNKRDWVEGINGAKALETGIGSNVVEGRKEA